MTTEIHRIEDCNERTREGRNGRIYESSSIKVVWLVVRDDETIADYDRLKDARAAYPDAKVIWDEK